MIKLSPIMSFTYILLGKTLLQKRKRGKKKRRQKRQEKKKGKKEGKKGGEGGGILQK